MSLFHSKMFQSALMLLIMNYFNKLLFLKVISYGKEFERKGLPLFPVTIPLIAQLNKVYRKSSGLGLVLVVPRTPGLPGMVVL